MRTPKQWQHLNVACAADTPTRALAIDPGGVTGFAIRLDADIVAVNQGSESWWVHYATDHGRVAVLIYEQFNMAGPRTAGSTAGMFAVGDIRTALRSVNNDLIIVAQTPQRRLAFVDQANQAGAHDHAGDALAHLLAWEFSC